MAKKNDIQDQERPAGENPEDFPKVLSNGLTFEPKPPKDSKDDN